MPLVGWRDAYIREQKCVENASELEFHFGWCERRSIGVETRSKKNKKKNESYVRTNGDGNDNDGKEQLYDSECPANVCTDRRELDKTLCLYEININYYYFSVWLVASWVKWAKIYSHSYTKQITNEVNETILHLFSFYAYVPNAYNNTHNSRPCQEYQPAT